MAVRNYTDKTKQRMLEQVKEVNNDMNSLGDHVGDGLLKIANATHIMDLYKYFKGTKAYQKSVIDMNDLTKAKIEKIFEEVHEIDSQYSGYYENIVDVNSTVNDFLKKLSEQIQPNFQINTPETIKHNMTGYHKALENSNKEIDEGLKVALPKSIKKTFSSGFKKAGKSILKIGITIATAPAKMIKGYFKGGLAGLGKETLMLTYDLCDGTYQTGYGLAGSFIAGVGGVALFFGFESFANHAYHDANKNVNTDKASEDDSLSPVGKKFFQSVESVHDTVELYDDITSLPETWNKIKGLDFSGVKDLKSSDYFKKGFYYGESAPLAALYKKFSKETINLQHSYKLYNFFDSIGKSANSDNILKNPWLQQFKHIELFTEGTDYKDTIHDLFN